MHIAITKRFRASKRRERLVAPRGRRKTQSVLSRVADGKKTQSDWSRLVDGEKTQSDWSRLEDAEKRRASVRVVETRPGANTGLLLPGTVIMIFDM